MVRGTNALSTLAALEARYDGPIPDPIRQVISSGSAERRLLAEAEGQAAFFAALIQWQIEAIRRARQQGLVPARLLSDLKLYRRQQFWWRRETERCCAAITPSAADVP